MSNSIQSAPMISGDELHQYFKRMTIEYGLMMTGVSPEIIGRTQADRLKSEDVDYSTLAKLSHDELDIVIQKLISANEDDMIKPSDSCGDQSNQICELFLGIRAADDFSNMKYNICVSPQDILTDLQQAILSSKAENKLVRFELDRGQEVFVFVLKDIKTLAELTSQLDRVKMKAVVLLDGLLCFIYNKKIIPLSISENEKKTLGLLFAAMQEKMSYDIYFSLRNPNDKFGISLHLDDENFVNLHQASFDALDKIISLQDSSVMNMWKGSHSFTLLIPGEVQSQASASNTTLSSITSAAKKLYQYQAYAGVHTFQKWLGSDKPNGKSKVNTIAELSVQEYISIMADLVGNNGKAKAKAYGYLFRQHGDEEARFYASALSGASSKEDVPLRLKYKVTVVNPALAKSNLDKLNHAFKEFGQDSKMQVDTYKNKIIQAFSEKIRSNVKTVVNTISLSNSIKR